MIRTAISGAALALFVSTTAQAGVLFAFEETSEGVFGTLSGSLDITNAISGGASAFSGDQMTPESADIRTVGDNVGDIDGYLVTGPSSFGSGSLTDASGGSGDSFILGNFRGQYVGLPRLYASGTELSGTLDFAGETFASLGVTPGDYVYEFIFDPQDEVPLSTFASPAPSDNTIVLRFGSGDAAVIPLPAGLPLLLAGLGAFALLRRTRG